MRFLPLLLGFLLPGAAFAETPTLTLTFTGDLMAHERNQSMADYGDIYRNLAPWLLTDDFSFVNLETPIDDKRRTAGYPQFTARPAYLEAAVLGGFDVFSLANNHSNDYGLAAIEGTLKSVAALESRLPLYWSGLKLKAGDPIEPIVLEKGGLKIGFVALTNLLNRWPGYERLNRVNLWDPWSRKPHPENQEALLEQVRAWRQNVDFLVLSLHDGVEYSSVPDPIQVELYTRLVAAGVDVMWCHHPHVLQPWKWVETERGRRVVMFSMGNLISRQSGSLKATDAAHPQARTGDGALMRLRLESSPTGVVIAAAEPVLLSNYPDPVRGMIVVPTETLVREAPGSWKDYYRDRWTVQQAWALPGD